MKKVLIFGAGRSAAALIAYLSEQDIHVHIVDVDKHLIDSYAAKYENVIAQNMNILNEDDRESLMQDKDIIISMLPARFHIHVAESCIKLKKHLLTASYIDDGIRRVAFDIEQRNLTFIYECGLDPGIDHMSAMKIMNGIKVKGGKITSFRSYTGGLMAPGSDDNPWKYKFTWNPRNVVLAGAGGTAQYLYKGIFKNIPHHQLFKRLSQIEIPDYGAFEAYPNRDSLKYQRIYQLDDIQTMIRGTLRRPGFSSAWNAFVQLGLTDDSYEVRGVEDMTFQDFVRTYLPYSKDPVEENFARYLHLDQYSTPMEKIKWLGLFEKEPIGLRKATPAQVVQKLLEKKWQASPEDHDMIVMQHQIGYELDGQERKVTSNMVIEGEMSTLSGMAKTVGYPLGIATMMVLNGDFKERGLYIPIKPSLYNPILEKIKEYGIEFDEKDELIEDLSAV